MSSFIISDGIIAWYNGPEWNDVVAEAFRELVPGIESEAQSNAPWEDQSGRARAGLNAGVEEGTEVSLYLAHADDVEYGFWLEVIQNGSFAIIMPTLEENAPRVMSYTATKVINSRKGRG